MLTPDEPMLPVAPPQPRLALLALVAALCLGILGDLALFDTPGLGLGGLLWVVGLVAGLLLVARAEALPLTGEGRFLLVGAVLFAGGLTWRASPLLQFLDVVAIGLCLGLAAMTARGGRLTATGVLSYPLGLALSAANHLVGPFALLFSDVAWSALPKGRWSKALAAILRGLLIAIPLLLLFGLLFAAADAVFAQLAGSLFAWNAPQLTAHLVGTLFFTFLAAGFLRTSLLRKPEELPTMPRPTGAGLGAIETGVILGLLNLLFLAFVLVQVGYLFGGSAHLAAAAELTYAEYARSGFFELVQVTALVLPVLLALHWLIPPEKALEHRLYRWLGSSLVLLLFVIMASALERMYLYQQEFGLTELRLYTTAFMGWMALLFLWFLATVMRGRRERFAIGALVSGLLVLFSLHLINPDGLIVRTNLAHLERTGRFDAPYATSLSPDGFPTLLAGLDRLSPEDQAHVREVLPYRVERLEGMGWRGWNWGRAQALRAFATLDLR